MLLPNPYALSCILTPLLTSLLLTSLLLSALLSTPSLAYDNHTPKRATSHGHNTLPDRSASPHRILSHDRTASNDRAFNDHSGLSHNGGSLPASSLPTLTVPHRPSRSTHTNRPRPTITGNGNVHRYWGSHPPPSASAALPIWGKDHRPIPIHIDPKYKAEYLVSIFSAIRFELGEGQPNPSHISFSTAIKAFASDHTPADLDNFCYHRLNDGVPASPRRFSYKLYGWYWTTLCAFHLKLRNQRSETLVNLFDVRMVQRSIIVDLSNKRNIPLSKWKEIRSRALLWHPNLGLWKDRNDPPTSCGGLSEECAVNLIFDLPNDLMLYLRTLIHILHLRGVGIGDEGTSRPYRLPVFYSPKDKKNMTPTITRYNRLIDLVLTMFDHLGHHTDMDTELKGTLNWAKRAFPQALTRLMTIAKVEYNGRGGIRGLQIDAFDFRAAYPADAKDETTYYHALNRYANEYDISTAFREFLMTPWNIILHILRRLFLADPSDLSAKTGFSQITQMICPNRSQYVESCIYQLTHALTEYINLISEGLSVQ
ncbi:hypothetical protein BJ684DRAFT_14594 [Piptocephalis cylindrospora]|uniref:Uncharacterized protein n=1 Tax=Piptocephalis cylindrospora TaxID=1907219 RepID=A0A4P9YAL3_9FUNG|nr:hypothetical protein BJ684DRAFT_14594 [Piptocephalis cylindrospora]|eukprot:RKP15130.1 hypothetical protein BJ684DRAFT_14594 [Piptocephalis cylindrospora]